MVCETYDQLSSMGENPFLLLCFAVFTIITAQSICNLQDYILFINIYFIMYPMVQDVGEKEKSDLTWRNSQEWNKCYWSWDENDHKWACSRLRKLKAIAHDLKQAQLINLMILKNKVRVKKTVKAATWFEALITRQHLCQCNAVM